VSLEVSQFTVENLHERGRAVVAPDLREDLLKDMGVVLSTLESLHRASIHADIYHAQALLKAQRKITGIPYY
jgi:hypothetical protein